MKGIALAALLVLALVACGGASKPPMQPDNDTATLAGDGGVDVPADGAAAPPK